MTHYWMLAERICAFEIDRNPLPKQRPRVVARFDAATGVTSSRAYTPRKTKAYETYVAVLARNAMGNREPEKGLVALRLTFYRARRDADCSNLAKAIEDPIQGIVYKNDNQVVDLHAQWFRDKENPRAYVEAWTVKGGD